MQSIHVHIVESIIRLLKMSMPSVTWSIKGYHVYHIRPSDEFKLKVEREFGDLDEYSMLVKVDNDKTISRVSANLCGVFGLMIDGMPKSRSISLFGLYNAVLFRYTAYGVRRCKYGIAKSIQAVFLSFG